MVDTNYSNPNKWADPDGYAYLENAKGTTILDNNFVQVYPGVSAQKDLSRVRVVPNPYIVGHRFESPLPPGITSGRGSRKVEFQNLPSDAKVHIFTARGQHIRSLLHDGNIFSGTIEWDLKTKENLDVAFGVYYYIVESNLGGKTSGKLAVIK